MDIQIIVADLFPVVLPILFALVAVVAKYFWTRLPENQHQLITSIANTAVTAVEQIYSGSPGSDKRMAAENIIVDMLAAMHIKIAPALIDAAIESAVYALNQQKATTPQTPAPAQAVVQRIQGAA